MTSLITLTATGVLSILVGAAIRATAAHRAAAATPAVSPWRRCPTCHRTFEDCTRTGVTS